MPLTFDMSLAELETYQGRNPRPDNFDAFWEEGLAEMREIDPQIEISPASFQTSVAECSDLYFTGVGGARVHAKLIRPNNALRSPSSGVDVPRLLRRCRRLVEQIGLRCPRSHRCGTRLPGSGRLVGRYGWCNGLDVTRTYYPRALRMRQRNCSTVRFFWIQRNSQRS